VIGSRPERPLVLAIAGHDPTGGAGIQADIEAIHACGARPATLVTALTAQNTVTFESWWPTDPEALVRQAELLFADLPIAAIKIGLVPDPGIAGAVRHILDERRHLPVVLDPVLAAGSGRCWDDDALCVALRELVAFATVVTPNGPELRRLAGADSNDEAAARLLDLGCGQVLMTGTHEDTPAVRNTLYGPANHMTWSWPRLPGVYHGSGCTLASALAAFLAQGITVASAAALAQAYTIQTLRHATRCGGGQWYPERLLAGERPG
jgi:hydroxymethylpyrimidine/phosphomethylpyrimidine kinase